MDHIVKDQLFKFTPEEPVSALSLDKSSPDDAPFETWNLQVKNMAYQNALIYGVGKQYLSDLYSIGQTLLFKQRPVKLLDGLFNNPFSSDKLQIPREPYRYLQLFVSSFCASKGNNTPDTIKEAFDSFLRAKKNNYPRLYAVDDEICEKIDKTRSGTSNPHHGLEETPEGLRYTADGNNKLFNVSALLLPNELYDLFFGELAPACGILPSADGLAFSCPRIEDHNYSYKIKYQYHFLIWQFSLLNNLGKP